MDWFSCSKYSGLSGKIRDVSKWYIRARILHIWVTYRGLASIFTVSPSICHQMMGPDDIILVFSMLSFKPTFSLSSFILIKRLFSSSLLSAVIVASYAHLKLLIFLPATLIPACDSSIPAFCMLNSAYKLNKQGDNIQPCCIPSQF